MARSGSGPGPGRCFPVFPKVDTPYGQALTGLKVQAPLGARVLSFVCCAPNDGFSPQSGLVQRGILYAAAWGSENHTTALRARKCISPLVAGVTTLPPLAGEVRQSRIGGGEPISRMLIMPYDTESQSRNADFNKLAAKPPPPPFEPSEPSEPFEPFEPSHRRRVQQPSRRKRFTALFPLFFHKQGPM